MIKQTDFKALAEECVCDKVAARHCFFEERPRLLLRIADVIHSIAAEWFEWVIHDENNHVIREESRQAWETFREVHKETAKARKEVEERIRIRFAKEMAESEVKEKRLKEEERRMARARYKVRRAAKMLKNTSEEQLVYEIQQYGLRNGWYHSG